MTRKLEYLSEAVADLAFLDNSIRQPVIKGIKKIQKNPVSKEEGGYGSYRFTWRYTGSHWTFLRDYFFGGTVMPALMIDGNSQQMKNQCLKASKILHIIDHVLNACFLSHHGLCC